ncbi:MAG: 50S ribosomal protein L5 [Anaerohalosphaeraceae bacterium]|nr:50S ribosomal protein L5 [Anaerohalosphaeraceae bacterium]
MARLKDIYKSKVLSALNEKYSYKSSMAIPKMQKVVISMGVGRAVVDKKFMEAAFKDMTQISGQKPVVCKAKKSVSNFKVREGDKTGLKVTLRGVRMYEFMDRLINLAIPRVKDFRGLSPKSFDGQGNYSMGLSEQSVFPEIDLAAIDNSQGMNITFVTTAGTDDEAKEMLRLFGMPFRE